MDDIRNVIYRFANSFDVKDWGGLLTVLDKLVFCDYTSLRGTAETIKATDYVQKRIEALSQLTTQHLFSNVEVAQVDKKTAVSRASAVILRRKGDRFFNTHAIYEFKLRLDNDHWCITAIKQTVLWNEGDVTLHRGAKPQGN